jgi:transcriptional regulator with XRE-family HTH domain
MDGAEPVGNPARMARPRPKKPARRIFLREWRKHRGLTQERLAERAEVTQGMISQLEGGTSDFTGELLGRLADALSCDRADLIMRNPLDPEAPWSIWDTLKPQQRRQALRLLKALADEEAA